MIRNSYYLPSMIPSFQEIVSTHPQGNVSTLVQIPCSTTDAKIQLLPIEMLLTIYANLELKDAWRVRSVSSDFYTAFKQTIYQKKLTQSAQIIDECVRQLIRDGLPWVKLYAYNPLLIQDQNSDIQIDIAFFENRLCFDEGHITLGDAKKSDCVDGILGAVTRKLEVIDHCQKLRWKMQMVISRKKLYEALKTHFSQQDGYILAALDLSKPFIDVADSIGILAASFCLYITEAVSGGLSWDSIAHSIHSSRQNLLQQHELRTKRRFDEIYTPKWKEVISEIIRCQGVSIECVCDELQKRFPPISAFDHTYGQEYSEEQEFFIRCLFGQQELLPTLYKIEEYEHIEIFHHTQ